MTSELLNRIGVRASDQIDQDVFLIPSANYGSVTRSTDRAKATDYYGAGLSGSCSLTDFITDFVVTTYQPLAPLSQFIPTLSRGTWTPSLEVRSKGKPSISSVMPACCGLKPQGQESNNGLLTYGRSAIATGIEICDLDKWVSRSSAYDVDLESEAISDRLEALTEVQGMMAIRGGFGLKGIVGNKEFPAVFLQSPISAMEQTGAALYKSILNIIRHTDLNYTPPGGYTLALPPQAFRALDVPYSDLIGDSVRSILLGTCTCNIPGVRPGLLKDIIEMPHLSCAAPGVGTGDMGLLFIPEFLSWDLPVPFQVIEPERCGLIAIGALIAHVGEIIQKRQGHAIKVFNV